MTITETLKLALEALVHAYHEDEAHFQTLEAIAAIREALASEAIEQPAQQWQSTADKCELKKVPANGSLLTRMMNERVKSNVKQVIELYDSPDQPSQRQARSADTWVNATTWRGLTAEERNTICENAGTWREAMKVIEAKLKEKNCG